MAGNSSLSINVNKVNFYSNSNNNDLLGSLSFNSEGLIITIMEIQM